MRVLLDLNVMLDFLQRREPFFESAASVMDRVLYGSVEAVLPAHGITTLYYFLSRGAEKHRVKDTMFWLLETFQISPCSKETLASATALEMTDYEDAVVAVSAESTGCTHIVSRNARDFAASPVPVLTPDEFLELLESA